MAGIHNKIVVAQRIWGTDAYIAYYDNGDAVMFSNLDDDAALQRFVQECSTEGCAKTVEFPVQTGAQSRVKCRQTIYCKQLTIGGSAAVTDTAANIINSVTKGGISYIIWSPTAKKVTVHEGLLNTGKPISVPDIRKASKSVLEFMQQCINQGYVLKRVYQTTVDNRLVTAVEFLFSMKKLPRDFKGSEVERVDEDELQSLGFEI